MHTPSLRIALDKITRGISLNLSYNLRVKLKCSSECLPSYVTVNKQSASDAANEHIRNSHIPKEEKSRPSKQQNCTCGWLQENAELKISAALAFAFWETNHKANFCTGRRLIRQKIVVQILQREKNEQQPKPT